MGVTVDGSALGKTAFGGARLAVFVRGVQTRLWNMSGDFDYERRMNNWRMWRLSDRRSLGGSPYPVYNLTPRPPRGENIMPILAGEAEETDRIVMLLPAALRRAVEVWYLSPASVNQKRKMLACRRERMFEMLEEARKAIKDNVSR